MVPFARYQSGCNTYTVVKRSSLSTSNNPTIQDYIRCQLRWMAHHTMRVIGPLHARANKQP